MTEDERQQQLQHDRLHRMEQICLPLRTEEQADEDGREEDAQQAGQRGATHGGGDVAARHRGEGDGGLHRSGQGAEIEETLVNIRRDERRRQWVQSEAEQRKEDERRRQHQTVQPPVADAGKNGLARELGAVHEKQQGDGSGGEVLEEGLTNALRGDDGRGEHHQQDHHEERVKPQTADGIHGQAKE